ncbi:MAG: alpha/beta hydrolase [Bacteroides sp.]|nr:alpha/beta hydrolase [Bacteroides sp.]
MRPLVIGFLFLLISTCTIKGQQANFPPCSLPVDWDQIEVTDSPLPESAKKFLIVTNRSYNADAPDGVVFTKELSEFRKVSYWLASCNGEKWLLNEVNDFMEGMTTIDNGRDILLFVHGHGKSFPSMLLRGNQIADKYDVSLLLFDWPSFNSNFNKSLKMVRKCGENYYNLLLQLRDYRTNMQADQHLSMLLHSLGNYFLTHLVVNGNSQYIDEKIFDNIIMNSAAVRSKEHGQVLSEIRMQENLYVIFNKNDKILRGAHLLTAGKMLGNVVIEPLVVGATYIDFTPVAEREHTYFAGYHQFEFDIPAFEEVFDTAFHGRVIDLSKPKMFSQKGSSPIWVVND